MNPDVRDRWAAALESDDYPQGRQHLALESAYDDGLVRYCCLGVLCELAVAAGVVARHDGAKRHYGADREGNYLPPEVVRWAGLDSRDPAVDLPGGCGSTLSQENDGGRPFREIAQLIREQL